MVSASGHATITAMKRTAGATNSQAKNPSGKVLDRCAVLVCGSEKGVSFNLSSPEQWSFESVA